MCWHAIIIDFITDHSSEPDNDNLAIHCRDSSLLFKTAYPCRWVSW